MLGACVPTTKYAYVPLTQQNFEAAQNGEKIPLVAHDTVLCFADGRTAPIRYAEWTDNGICGQAHPPIGDDDGNRCYDWDQIAGIGIPYEGRSLSVIPMAAVQIGKCDPEALAE
ncbi:MAG: hypothetical protein CMF06_12885 [Hyphomonas sp.]|nr:hypothetical protein [Hyphomonas sp.]MAU67868.1 hypothetical protein [Hyphomonas sp.]MBM58527.1 hypothetical protein [Hyphomonas sp.]